MSPSSAFSSLSQTSTYFCEVIEPGPLAYSVTGIQTTALVDPVLVDPTESLLA